MESPFDESVGTDISSTETSSHRANDTPSLSQLLEERTPSTGCSHSCQIQQFFLRVNRVENANQEVKLACPVPLTRLARELRREQGLRRAQIKELQALIPRMMLRRGSHSPIEARQVYKTPEIVSPYFWCASNAIARQWYRGTGSTTLCVE